MQRGHLIKRFLMTTAWVFLLAAASAWGQSSASLRGTVSDPSGAVIPNARVTLTNAGTGVEQATTARLSGEYVFPQVLPGTYSLEVESAGFQKYVQRGIVLEVNQAARIDVSLKVGAATQLVEVTENAPQVSTVNAELGSVESEKRILDLPLVERDTLLLGLLQAGVFPADPSDGSGNPYSVSGQRSESLTFLVDGADNNDFLGNNIVVNANPDAIREFKILTNNYSAEFGRTSGGIVNQVTKSGTNTFHGDIFEFFRNDVLNARDFFLLDRTSFKRNLFGGTVGGPIRKDKTFFFGAYQASRRREGQVAPVLQVLSPAERTGDFSELLPNNQLVDPVTGNPFLNNQVPVNPISKNYIDRFLPLPNLAGNRFVSGPVGRVRDDQGVLHIDQVFSERDVLTGVYLIDDNDDFLPFRIINGASTGGNVPVGSGFTDRQRSQVGTLSWTHTFSPSMINETRFSANRVASVQASPVDKTTPAELGFTNVNPDDPGGVAPPIIFTPTFNLGPSPQGPTTLVRNTFQWQDTLSVVKGKHEMKFGADIRRIQNNFVFDFFNNGSFDFGRLFGSFTGDPLADFVGGFPDNFFQFSSATYGIRTTQLNFFGQDNWKVTPKLTLNLGLRYEYNTPQRDPHNNILGFFPGKQSTVFPDAPPGILYPGDPGTPNRGLVFPDKNNFAPRFGFAYDVLGNSKLVLRGGFGIFYDLEDGALNLQFGGEPPFGDVINQNFFPPGAFAGAVGVNPVSDPFGAAGIPNPFPFAASGRTGQFFVPKLSFAFVVDPHFRTPYSENYNFGLQYQLTHNTLVEAYYVGSLGRKLISSGEVNFPNPDIEKQQLAAFGSTNPDCARPLAGCGNPLDPNASPADSVLLLTNFSNGISDSHELQVTVDKRMSHGFTFRTAYTLSKTIDLTSGFRERSFGFTDPLNFNLDRGLADFDVTQRVVLSGIWELPYQHGAGSHAILRKLTEGWQLNSIVSFQSGFPFKLFQNNDSSQQANFLDRPDQLGPIQVFNDPRNVHTFGPDADGIHGSCLPDTATGNFFFNPTNLDCASVPLFTFGTLGRNALRGPGINNWDLSIFKNTYITESKWVQFHAEFFNAWNRAQFLNPDPNGFSGTFGQITSTRPPRLIQFALKLNF